MEIRTQRGERRTARIDRGETRTVRIGYDKPPARDRLKVVQGRSSVEAERQIGSPRC